MGKETWATFQKGLIVFIEFLPAVVVSLGRALCLLRILLGKQQPLSNEAFPQ